MEFGVVLKIITLMKISKILMINLLESSENSYIAITNFLSFSLIWNEGIAFGLLSFDESYFYNFLTILIIIIIIVIFFMTFKSKGLKKYSFLMILGGALGNLYDRIFFKAVPDFIDFHIGNFHWFIFNVSDIFISLGVLFLISLELINNKKDKIDENN